MPTSSFHPASTTVSTDAAAWMPGLVAFNLQALASGYGYVRASASDTHPEEGREVAARPSRGFGSLLVTGVDMGSEAGLGDSYPFPGAAPLPFVLSLLSASGDGAATGVASKLKFIWVGKALLNVWRCATSVLRLHLCLPRAWASDG